MLREKELRCQLARFFFYKSVISHRMQEPLALLFSTFLCNFWTSWLKKSTEAYTSLSSIKVVSVNIENVMRKQHQNTKPKWSTTPNLYILRTKPIRKLVQFLRFVCIFYNRTCILETSWASGAQKREHKIEQKVTSETHTHASKQQVCQKTQSLQFHITARERSPLWTAWRPELTHRRATKTNKRQQKCLWYFWGR